MKNLLILLFFAIIVASCQKDETFSKIPEVTFERYDIYSDAAGVDTTVDFIFSLKDGDGDIGFKEGEFNSACGADNSNLYLAYEEKSGDNFVPKKIWTQVTDITANCDTNIYFDSVQVVFNQRMQYIEPAGNSKSIEATVKYRMDYLSAVILLSKAGRFKFYIRDRANNLSNVVVSPELNITK